MLLYYIMNNKDLLNQVSNNVVDRLNILNSLLNNNDISAKKKIENEKELKMLNNLFLYLRQVIKFYIDENKNK